MQQHSAHVASVLSASLYEPDEVIKRRHQCSGGSRDAMVGRDHDEEVTIGCTVGVKDVIWLKLEMEARGLHLQRWCWQARLGDEGQTADQT